MLPRLRFSIAFVTFPTDDYSNEELNKYSGKRNSHSENRQLFTRF
jgi:hypothetical protein